MKILTRSVLLLGVVIFSFSSCDIIEEVEECVKEFEEYEDRFSAYEDIEGDICDNQDAAADFIDFLENEAKGSCVEDQLANQDQDLDDIIAEAKADLAECTN